jgi:hypothetical protein
MIHNQGRCRGRNSDPGPRVNVNYYRSHCHDQHKSQHASGINVLLGIWLIMSPSLCSYAAAPVYPTSNNVIADRGVPHCFRNAAVE